MKKGDLVSYTCPDFLRGNQKKTVGVVTNPKPRHWTNPYYKHSADHVEVIWASGKTSIEWDCYLEKIG
tara:strand:- start:517 stop:720 length:204 start_codon:yes stop_codon:yes gene_type:complete